MIKIKELKNNALVSIMAVGLVIVALVLAFGSRSEVNISGSGQIQKDTISVSGNAEMTVEPDQAELYVRIETTKKTAQEAKDENSQISDSVESALRQAGVGKDDMETEIQYLSTVQLQPYNWKVYNNWIYSF